MSLYFVYPGHRQQKNTPSQIDTQVMFLRYMIIGMRCKPVLEDIQNQNFENPETRTEVQCIIELCEDFLEQFNEYPDHEPEAQDKIWKVMIYFKELLIGISYKLIFQDIQNQNFENPETKTEVQCIIELCEDFLEQFNKYPDHEPEAQAQIRELLKELKEIVN